MDMGLDDPFQLQALRLDLADQLIRVIKGDTASGGVKPATLSTGAVVRVPLFVDQGEVIKVDTRSREYVSRVK